MGEIKCQDRKIGSNIGAIAPPPPIPQPLQFRESEDTISPYSVKEIDEDQSGNLKYNSNTPFFYLILFLTFYHF